MDQFADVLKAVGLPPVLATSAVALSIIIRLARARLTWFTWSVGYAVALALSALVTFSERSQLTNPVTSGLALFAVALIGQGILQSLAGVVPWIPRDNDLVPKPPNQGGTP